MSIRYISVASGSSGNCHYIEKNGTKILIDAGISGKRIENALKEHNADLIDLSAVMITHEHTDHIKSVGVISRRYDVPVYATEKTWAKMGDCLGKIKEEHKRVFVPYQDIEINDLLVRGFSTSHDAVDSCGFTLTDGNARMAIATDLGCITKSVQDSITGCELVVLESNHDIEMLKVGSYPYYLKKRVLSEYGHLSNVAAGDIAASLVESGTKAVLLAHLSQENNMPIIAYQTVAQSLKERSIDPEKDLKLMVLSRNFVSEIFIV